MTLSETFATTASVVLPTVLIAFVMGLWAGLEIGSATRSDAIARALWEESRRLASSAGRTFSVEEVRDLLLRLAHAFTGKRGPN